MRPTIEHAPRHWHINLQESWEVEFWAKELDCSEQVLRAAVATVGDRSRAVRDFLEAVERRLPHRP